MLFTTAEICLVPRYALSPSETPIITGKFNFFAELKIAQTASTVDTLKCPIATPFEIASFIQFLKVFTHLLYHERHCKRPDIGVMFLTEKRKVQVNKMKYISAISELIALSCSLFVNIIDGLLVLLIFAFFARKPLDSDICAEDWVELKEGSRSHFTSRILLALFSVLFVLLPTKIILNYGLYNTLKYSALFFVLFLTLYIFSFVYCTWWYKEHEFDEDC